jgi:hypothetical protein
MAYQAIGLGASANDGSGDTLRAGATKLNANFVELYDVLGGSGATSLSSGISASSTVISLSAPNISGVVAGTQTSATITTLATTTVNGTTLNGGTLALAAGSITDSSGAISFGNENISTTGTATLATVDINAGAIDGTVIGANSAAAGTFAAIVGTSFSIGGLVVAAGSLTDSSGAISFGNENISTTGNATVSGTATLATVDINAGAIDGTTIGGTSAAAGTFTSLVLGANGTIVLEGSTANSNEITITVIDPTSDQTVTIPNETGTFITTGSSNNVTGNMLKNDSTLLIKNSGGTTLKTVIGAGSAT